MSQAPKGIRVADTAHDHTMRQERQRLKSPSKKRQPFRTRSVSAGPSLIGEIVDISEVIAIAEGKDHK